MGGGFVQGLTLRVSQSCPTRYVHPGVSIIFTTPLKTSPWRLLFVTSGTHANGPLMTKRQVWEAGGGGGLIVEDCSPHQHLASTFTLRLTFKLPEREGRRKEGGGATPRWGVMVGLPPPAVIPPMPLSCCAIDLVCLLGIISRELGPRLQSASEASRSDLSPW